MNSQDTALFLSTGESLGNKKNTQELTGLPFLGIATSKANLTLDSLVLYAFCEIHRLFPRG